MKIKIGSRLVGQNEPCFIIAEAGVNHNGKLDLALKLVDVAAAAGADAVKFQTFKAEQVVTKKGRLADYQRNNLGKLYNQREMLKGLELKEKFYQAIVERCRKKNIVFLSTPHGGKQSVDFLESLNVPAYKIGSGDLLNYLLFDKVARLGKPIILSTGMATLKEIEGAISFIKSRGNQKIIALHCTTAYPCPLDEVNLAAMLTMVTDLSVPVGYSDHTVGNQIAIMAVTLGAVMYECHFTLDKKLPGPDHLASAEPQELKSKIKAIRNVEKIMGKKDKMPTKKECLSTMIAAKKSLVASRNLKKGSIIKQDCLEAKRPGDGLAPSRYENIIGKKLIRNIDIDEQILLSDLI